MIWSFKWLFSFRHYCSVVSVPEGNIAPCFWGEGKAPVRWMCRSEGPLHFLSSSPGPPRALCVVTGHKHVALCSFLHFWDSPALQVPEKHILQRGRTGRLSGLYWRKRSGLPPRTAAYKGAFKAPWAQVPGAVITTYWKEHHLAPNSTSGNSLHRAGRVCSVGKAARSPAYQTIPRSNVGFTYSISSRRTISPF